MKQIHKEFYTLSNEVNIPKVAFGTWQIQGEDAYNSTVYAIKAGYIHIDTALAYGNEKEIGKALKDLNVKREEIFITSKLPAEIKGYEEAKNAFNTTITNLGIEYLDLYLIHAPLPWSEMWGGQYRYEKENLASWCAMEELYNEGKIRSIGVSNFHVKDLKAIIEATNFKPHVNQIRYFVGNRQDEISTYCLENNILIEAYSPLATGELVNHPKMQYLAEKYKVSIPQICLKYCLEKGTLPIPKSTNLERMKTNIDLNF